MKKLFCLVMLLAVVLPLSAMADCLATQDQVAPAFKIKAEAIQARESGDLVGAAAKFQEAAGLHPMEVYKALYLLNAEGCLVGKWNPISGYRYVTTKGEANKVAAQALLDQVKTLLAKVDADGCDYDNGSIDRAKSWYSAAQDALNGTFH